MGDERGRACQSVDGAISNDFFVNCYSVFASIKQVRIEVINSFNFLL